MYFWYAENPAGVMAGIAESVDKASEFIGYAADHLDASDYKEDWFFACVKEFSDDGRRFRTVRWYDAPHVYSIARETFHEWHHIEEEEGCLCDYRN